MIPLDRPARDTPALPWAATAALRSLPVVALCGTLAGMALALRGYPALVASSDAESLGAFVAVTATRELGPVLAALVFAGHACNVRPARQRTSPADAIASALAVPVLAAVFTLLAVGLGGAHLVGVHLLGIDDAAWRQQVHAQVGASDILGGLIKGAVFGSAVASIAGAAAERTRMLLCALAVLGIDVVLTALMFPGP